MASQNAAYAQDLLSRQAAANAAGATPIAAVPPAPGQMPPMSAADIYAAGTDTTPPEVNQAQFFSNFNRDAQVQGENEAKTAEKLEGPPVPTDAEKEAQAKAEFAKTLPPGLITSPEQLYIQQAQTAADARNANRLEEKEGLQYAHDKEKLDSDLAERTKPLYDDAVKQNQESYDRQKAAHLQVQKDMDAKLAHYQSVQDEMTKLANEKPQDLFGQAGVNRVMGSIALFFGGAGMAGFGPNHALETFNNMADRNIASQREHYERLAKIGMQDQSMYGMLANKLQSGDAAEAAMRNAYGALAESKVKAYASEFAKPQARLEAQKLIIGIRGERRKNDLQVAQTMQGQALGAMQMIQTQETLRNKEVHAQHHDLLAEMKYNLEAGKFADSQAQRDQETQIGGFTGHAPTKEHARLSKVAGGARTLVDMLGQMRKMVGKHMSPAQLRAYSTAQAINTMGARQFFETGTRLEEGENKQIATVALSQLDNLFYQLQNATTGTDVAALLDKIEDTQALITRATNMTITTAAPGMKIDNTDKVWGRFNPDSYKSNWEKETTENEGTPEGAQELDAMPAYNADKAVSNQELAAEALRKRYGRK